MSAIGFLRGCKRQAGRPGGKAVSPVTVAACLLACAAVVTVAPLVACGEQAGAEETGSKVVVEANGSIDPSDPRDLNHGDLPYDAYTFEAKKLDRVRVEVVAEGFIPLLKLVEVSTGAPLWEWEEKYSDEDALVYTIAGTGVYEARVYALEDGTGTYRVSVILDE